MMRAARMHARLTSWGHAATPSQVKSLERTLSHSVASFEKEKDSLVKEDQRKLAEVRPRAVRSPPSHSRPPSLRIGRRPQL